MKKEDIQHLANLARIKLTEDEVENLGKDLSEIVSYVSVVSEMVSDNDEIKPELGAVSNVFRKDDITNEANEYTEDIMSEMPDTEGRFLLVKKILKADN